MCLTFIFDKAGNKKIFKLTHIGLRKYELPKNLNDDLEGEPVKLELSETGTYIFAASKRVICLYRRDKEEPIYRYEK